MKVKFLQLPTTVQHVVDTTIGCRQALENLAQGRKPTPRSWFYEHKSPEWIQQQVDRELASMQDLPLISDWDRSFWPKYGPQGEAAPLQERLDGFDEYFVHLDCPKIMADPMFKKAQLNIARKLGFNHSGKPMSVDAVISQGLSNDKYNTSSAYRMYLRKKSPLALSAAKHDAPHCIEEQQPNTPGTRATPGKTGVKARNIFMTAMAVVLNGQRFQKPLQEYIRAKGIEFFAPWDGPAAVQRIVSTFERSTWKLSADYDKMDQHFNKHHGMAVFEVIKHYFQPKYWDELEKIIGYVFSQPILTNLGYIDQDHALVSGSEWTNFLETFWNLLFWEYMELKYHLKTKHKIGIGDDQLIEFDGSERWSSIKANGVLTLVIDQFEYAGTPGQKEKNLFSRDTFEFCQRKADIHWSGADNRTPWALVYRLSRCAEMSVFPETFHNQKMEVGGKRVPIYNKYTFAIGIAMKSENAIYHPKFRWWCEFSWHANPAIRELTALTDEKLREQEKRARMISNLNPTYNQEKEGQSLLEFETLKIWRELMHKSGVRA